MTDSTHPHPDNKTLSAFARGMLDEDQTEFVAQHVESCAQCAAEIDAHSMSVSELAGDLEFAAIAKRPVSAFKIPGEQNVGNHAALELQDVLGSGGMGIVFRAWQPALSRYVAVKQLHRHTPAGSRKSIARFQREIRALGRVQHPHLVRIFFSGISDDGWLYYAMELIEGTDLSNIHSQWNRDPAQTWQQSVRAACEQNSPSSSQAGQSLNENDDHAPPKDSHTDDVRRIVDIIRQVADAVACLHDAGIIHRDIKPANIMVNANGDHATLTDLGLAGFFESETSVENLTRTGAILGTPPYLAPERYRGQAATESGDIYCLGVVLWELLTRRRLFDTTSKPTEAELVDRILYRHPGPIRKFRPETSPDLEAVVLKCLNKDPAERYASARAFIEDLSRAQRGKSVTAERHSWRTSCRHFLQPRRKALTWLVTIIVVQLAIFVGIYAMLPAPKAFQPTVVFQDVGNGVRRPTTVSNLRVGDTLYDVRISYKRNGATIQLKTDAISEKEIRAAALALHDALNSHPANDAVGTRIRFNPPTTNGPAELNPNPGSAYYYSAEVRDNHAGNGNWEIVEGDFFAVDESDHNAPAPGFAQFTPVVLNQTESLNPPSGKPAVDGAVLLNVAATRAFDQDGELPESVLTPTHNGAGLASPFPAQLSTHTGRTEDVFVSPGPPPVSLHYDLGTQQRVHQIRFWNYCAPNLGYDGSQFGAHHIRIFGSNNEQAFADPEHNDWQLLKRTTLSRAPQPETESFKETKRRFLKPINHRFIRIQIDSNRGAEKVGLAEIQFVRKNDDD